MGIFGPPNIKKMKATSDVKGLIGTLSYRQDMGVLTEAKRALREIGTPAVELLITALKDKNAQVREYAANVLGGIGDTRAVDPLIATITDDVESVRCAAAWALAHKGNASAVEPLIAALKSEVNIARAAAGALGEIGDIRAADPLLAALKDDKEGSDIYAISLGQIGDARAVEPLIVLLKDENWCVRCGAAECLGEIGDARAVEPLIATLKDDESDVGEAAAEALKKIGNAAAIQALNQFRKKESARIKINIKEFISEGDVEGLIHILDNKDLDEETLELTRNALIDFGEIAMTMLFIALGDSQRIAGMNQLKQEGRLNEVMIQVAIGKAVSDYRRNLE